MRTIDVNKAWDQLYTRLENEELLVSERKKIPFIVKIKRIAAVIVLCIIGGAFAVYFGLKENEQLISIHNNDNFNTLVSTLEDGSIVYLASGTILSHPEKFAADKRYVSLQGEAQFNVQSNKNCPFIIETQTVMVEVTGTEFNIKSTEKDAFELYVMNGSVMVTLKSNGVSDLIESGEMVCLNNNRLQKSLLKNPTNYTQKMQFKDENLDNIVRVINTLSDKPIVFADSKLKKLEMTITFNNNTIIEMVGLLCEIFDLKYSENENDIVIDR